MLLRILDYLKKQKIASNQQMAREFGIDITALQPMLAVWIEKGRVKTCQRSTSCQKSCFRCQSEPPVYYELVI